MSIRQPQTVNGFEFQVELEDLVYYASALNGLPLVLKMSISNASGAPASNVELKISLSSLGRTLTLPFSVKRGTFGTTPIVLHNLDLRFDSAFLFEQPDSQPGELVVELSSNGEPLAEVRFAIEVMPAETWSYYSETGFLSLAAFAQPNSPQLRPVLDSASAKMGNTGLSGYQEPGKVSEIVKAIYAAVIDLQLTYSDPPASWDIPGQKVRLASVLTTEKVATCLDSAIFFASLMEAVGLNPVIGVIPGHAFVGYWTPSLMTDLGRDSIPDKPILSSLEIMTYLDNGYLELFETTVVTRPEGDKSFEAAVKEVRVRMDNNNILGAGHSRSAFVDVVSARWSRESRVRPLPAKVVSADGSIEVFEYKAEAPTVTMLQSQLATELNGRKVSASQLNLNAPPAVRVWLDQLLDLSLRNPLINFTDRSNSRARINLPSETIGLLEDQLQAGTAFLLNPAPKYASGITADLENDRGATTEAHADFALREFGQGRLLTHFPEEVFANRLRKIANEASVFQEETGSNGLYLALGTLEWSTKTKSTLTSPLILLAVKLRSKSRGKEWVLEMDESGVTPNFSLVEKLKQEHQLNLPHLAELKADDIGIDVAGTFKYIRDELIKAGLADFRIDERAVLGMFNFSTYRLWRDLLDNWKRFEKQPLVRHLIHTPGEAFLDSAVEETDDSLDDLIAKLPISSDGSQAKAIAKALRGETFVLQGPPGTGKSQTISNLFARALHEGKRVLFVTQKQDAAQVVKDRLEGVGLSAFSLDLHDKNLSIGSVREQLAQVIDIAVQPDRIGFSSAVSSYESAVAPLASYRNRLHTRNQFGDSIYTAQQKLLAIPEGQSLRITGDFVGNAQQADADALENAAKKIAIFGPQAGTAAQNPWSFAKISTSDLENSNVTIRETLREILRIADRVQNDKTLLEYIENSADQETFEHLSALNISEAPDRAVRFAMEESNDDVLDDTTAALQSLKELLATIPNSGIAFANQDWSMWRTATQTAAQGSGLFRTFKLNGIRKKIGLQLGMVLPGSPNTLLTEIDAFSNVTAAVSKAERAASELRGFTELAHADFADVAKIESLLTQISQVRQVADFTKTVRESGPQPKELLHLQGGDLISDIQDLAKHWRSLNEVLCSDSSSKKVWASGKNHWKRFFESVAAWNTDLSSHNLSKLSAWSTLFDELKHFGNRNQEDAVFELVTGVIAFEDCFNAFRRGFYSSMIEVLAATNGFATFNGATIDAYISQVTESSAEIRKRLPKVLGAELLERRGFNSTVKVGAIGDLMAVIRTAKRGMTLKTMLRNHWPIIQQITPLVIASPDSCVRFIDADLPPFDLVVFDEASQLRVATTIGALGRANSAIVVGDSEQMPPTSVAQAQLDLAEDEDDESAIMAGDSESILSMCVDARVPEIMLSWHYRSEDEALIAFSNHSYYGGSLNTLPSPSRMREGVGLKLTQLKGQFIRSGDGSSSGAGKTLAESKRKGTNPVEALAIVDEIRRRARDPELSKESVGVVTLNQQQQKYIRELLDTSTDKVIQDVVENGLGGEPVFVKNLETVQGSERAVILFSVAFSSPQGKPEYLPLQFGPIGHAGGHRRLNVAITRAQRFMHVFCSFEPQTLINRKPSSKGLKDLGEFLLLAKSEDKSTFQVLASNEETLDQHRQEVANALRLAGLIVNEDVGLSDFKVDIAIMDPKNPTIGVLAVMLDGPRWNNRVTTVDRDVLPTELLKWKMGWAEVERVWLPSWIRDPQSEIDRITRSFEAELAKPKPKRIATTGGSPAPKAPIFEQVTPIENHWDTSGNPIKKLFLETRVARELEPELAGNQEWLDHLHLTQVKQEVLRLGDLLVDAEGPVSPTRLARYIASCFGFGRVVQNRIDAINGVFPSTRRDSEGFLYPAGLKPINYSQWQRGDEKSKRGAIDISIIEIGNAMSDIASAAQGMREEQLMREVIEAFGLKRITKTVNDRLVEALETAVKTKKLKLEGEYITAT